MPDPILSNIQEQINKGVYNEPININEDRVAGGDTGFDELGEYDEGLLRGMDQSNLRADNQTGRQALGNAIVQAAGEIGLGTLEGVGYLLDFEQHYNILKGTETEFSNSFSSAMRKAKEDLGEAMPIHGGEGFQPLNGRWWAKNAPSIASSLSLLVPTSVATIGLAKAGKAIGLGGKLSKGSSIAAKGLTGALISRYMENTMEATEVYEKHLSELLQKGEPEFIAKGKAGQAASNAWYANLVNLVTDIPQYMFLFGKTDDALRGMMKATAGKKKSIGKKFMGLAGNMASEGLEEGIQFGIGQEAGTSNNVADTLQSVFNNFGDYIEDDEFKSSVLLGAVGGGIFSTLGSATDKFNNRRLNRLTEYSKAVQEDNETRAEQLFNEELIDTITEGSERSNQILEAAQEEDNELKIKIDDLKESINTARNSIDKIDEDLNEEDKEKIIKAAKIESNYKTIEKSNQIINKTANKVAEQLNTDGETITNKTNEEKIEETITPELIEYIAVKKLLEPFNGETDINQTKFFYNLFKKFNNLGYGSKDLKKLESKIENIPASKKLLKEIKSKYQLQLDNIALKENKSNETILEKGETLERKHPLFAKDEKLKRLNADTYKKFSRYRKNTVELSKKEKEQDKLGEYEEAIKDDKKQLNYYKNKPASLLVDFNGKYKNYEDLVASKQDTSSLNKLEELEAESKIDFTPNQPSIEEVDNALIEAEKILNATTPEENAYGDVDLPVEDPTIENIKDEEVTHTDLNNTPVADEVANQLIGYNDPIIEEAEIVETEQKIKDKKEEVIPVVKKEVNLFSSLSFKRFPSIRSVEKVTFVRREGNLIIIQGGDKIPSRLPINKDTYNSATGMLTVEGKKYWLNTKLVEKQIYLLRDENGVPIDSPLIENWEVDTKYVKSLHTTNWQDKDVKLVVKDSDWNKKNKDPLKTAISVEVDGKIVGFLQSATKFQNNIQYVTLYKELFNAYNSSNSTTYYPNTFKIKRLERGGFNIQKNRNTPSSILQPNQKLQFGVGYSSPEGGTLLKTNGVADHLSPSNVEPGQIYLLSTDLSGQITPIRLFRKKVQDIPTLKRKLLKALNKLDMPTAQSIVKVGISVKGTKKYLPDLNDGMRFSKPITNNKGEYNSYNSKYNNLFKEGKTTKDLIEKGAIIGLRSGNSYNKIYGISSIKGDSIKVVELNSDLEKVENTPIQTLTFEDLKSYDLHYSYNYYQFYGLGDKPLQVDHNLINTKRYNEEVFDERLESDLVPGDHFFNGGIRIDIQNSKETVKEVEKIVNKPKSDKRKEVKSNPSNLGKSGLFRKLLEKQIKNVKYKLKESVQYYNTWNQAEETQWFKERFPDTPLHILENLKDIGLRDAWGAFYKGAAYIKENAGEGTLYHESFHLVFSGQPTYEQERILDEAYNKYSKSDFNQKKLELGETATTEAILEELLADDFANYMLTKKSKTSSSKLINFFKRLWELITFVINSSKSSIDTLFRNIDKGNFDSRYKSLNTAKYRFNETLKNIFNPAELEDAVDLGTHLLNQAIEAYSKIVKKENDVLEAIVTDDLSKNLLTSTDIPFSVPNLLVKHFAALPVDQQDRESFEKFLDAIVVEEDGKLKKQPLYYEIQSSMSKYGLVITPKTKKSSDLQVTDDVVFEFNEDTVTRDSWGENINKVSGLERLSHKLRVAFGNVPITTKEGNGYKVIRGYLGFPKKYTSGYVYKQLQVIAGNSYNVDHMLKKIVEKGKSDTMFQYIGDMLSEDSSLVTDLFISIGQRIKPRFISIIQDKLGKFSINNSNVNSKQSIVQEELYLQFENNTKLLNSKGEAVVNSELTNTIAEHKKGKSIDSLKKAYKLLGFTFNYDKLTEGNIKQLSQLLLGTHPKRGKALVNLIENPIKYTESEVFRYITDITKDSFPNLLQDTHKNTDGGQVFEWITPNYAGKMLLRLQNDSKLLTKFKEDIRYRFLPILKKNFSKLNYVIFNDLKLNKERSNSYDKMSKKQLYINILASYASNKGTAIIPLPVHSDSSNMSGFEIPISRKIGEQQEDWKEGGENLIMGDLIDLAFAEFIRVLNPHSRQRTSGEFVYFDTLNPIKEDLIAIYNQSGEKAIRDLLYKGVKEKLNAIYKKELDTLKKLNLVKETEGKLEFSDGNFKRPVEPLLKEFVANYALYYPQISMLTNSDFSFYKNVNDFYKRAKQVWSPGLYLDTTNIRPTYKTLFVEDNETAFQLADIKKAVKALFSSTTQRKRDEVVSKFEEVNESDGGSYIDLYRYKEQEVGLGRWNDEKQADYEALMAGKRSKTKFNTRKPFYYSLHFEEDGIYPVQNKDSEAILVPEYGLKFIGKDLNPLYNPKYKEYLEKMGYKFTPNSFTFDESGRDQGKYIDKVSFLSASKAAIIKPDEIITMANSEWRLQMETPLHHIDDKVIFAVQVRKHIINDIGLNDDYTLPNGDVIKGQKLFEEYNRVIIADIQDSLNTLNKQFDSVDALLELLREEIIKRQLGNQYLEALDIDPVTNETKLPLYHPLHLYRVEAIANSLFKNRVTRQKLTNGVTLINQSSFGFENKPEIIFNEDGSISHFEAYVSSYSKKLDKYRDKETGQINADIVPDTLKEGLVWRIPNEDKYSTVPIKIKGFLPDSIGGAIVLPPEITTIAGLDFDIDKMFGFFNNEEKFNPDYTYNDYVKEVSERKQNLLKHYGLDDSSNNEIQDFLKESDNLAEELQDLFNIDSREEAEALLLETGNIVSKEEFDSYQNQSKAARDNYKFNLMWAVMTNPKTSKAILIGGGFDTLKRINEKSILPKREKIGNIELGNLDILAPSTHVNISDRMLTGQGLIGISANANTAHSLFQGANLTLERGFSFEGNNFNKLGTKEDIEGNLVTRNIAETLAAFVDNGKDPQASYSNINSYTVDVLLGMLMTGIPLETSLYFLTQPSIIEFTNNYFDNNSNESKALSAAGYPMLPKKDTEVKNFNSTKLFENIDKPGTEYQKEALKAFLLYKRLVKPLSKLVLTTKIGESGNGPTGSHNLFKINMFKNTEQFNGIVGVEDFLAQDNFANKLNEVLEIGAKAITKNTKIPSRTENQFNILFGELNALNVGRDLNAQEMEFAFKNYMDFVSTKDLKHNLDLIKELPSRLARYKKAYPDNPFTSRLRTNKKGLIFYTGLNNQDKSVVDRIRYTWETMLNTPKSEQFAKDLALYSFMVSGWRATSNSFSHLLPISYFENSFNIEPYIANIENTAVAIDLMAKFKDQFIRNHYRNLYYIPTVEKANNVIVKKKDKTVYSIVLPFNDSNYQDNQGDNIEFIKYEDGQELRLYKYIGRDKTGAKYLIVNPLGTHEKKRGKFFTEYDIEETSMKSKYPNNNFDKFKDTFINENTSQVEEENDPDIKKVDCKDGL